MDCQLMNLEAAYRKVINLLLKRGAYIDNIVPLNEGRYILAKTTIGNFLILYKRDLFRSFYKLEGCENKTVGESVNVEHLKFALQRDVIKIFTTYPSGHIYSIDMIDFLTKSIKWTNLEGIEVRSCSIKEFKREDEKG